MPPRPLAPLSTGYVTSQRPTFKWALAAGTEGAQVDICADRACTTIELTLSVPSGMQARPPAPLAPGVVFWRLHGIVGGRVGIAFSPTWEFVVGASSASVDTSWGTNADFDGDGYSDVLVGASGNAAYVYPGGKGGPGSKPSRIIAGTASAPFAVASAGDVNGDGFADALVATGTTMVGVFLGGPRGLSSTAAVTLSVPDHGCAATPSGAGDVNCDGYADVAIGDNCIAQVLVFAGAPTGPTNAPIATLTSTVGSGLGWSVSGAGDANGDGYSDLLLGSWGLGAFLYWGGPSGLNPSAVLVQAPSCPSSSSTLAAFAGDINGDGYSDMAVASPNVGTVFVYLSGPFGPKAEPTSLSGAIQDFGFSISAAGDMNGDGFDDLAVGRALLSGIELFTGGPSGIATSPSAQLGAGTCGGCRCFLTSAFGGDINGDGFADLLVGNEPDAYAFLGAATLPGPRVTLNGPACAVTFGYYVARTLRPDRHRHPRRL